ncbi:beta-phosphoglucomutase family hydrolase [Nocardia sp. 2YAB30]|uniref:beta-phosphoglucomutase family hydrolase n=1 Tax=unclassified Nocardia TaxID=2637762 RepID=UPI003F9B11B5
MTPVERTWSRVGLSTLGMPQPISACLFDLDGVLTDTAKVHAAAWKEMFDSYLRTRAQRGDEPFVAFDPVAEYDTYVDGRPRIDGARAFLTSRGIDLPLGGPGAPPDVETVTALANRKNTLVLRRIQRDGVRVYPGSARYVRAVGEAGLRRAVVSSSTNCRDVLIAAGIENLFEQRIDGVTAEHENLAGKPAPDMFLAAARSLDVEPENAAVFEDALAGVAAGRAGGFGFVIGVDRIGQAEELTAHGADQVVTDLSDLLSLP